MFVCVCLEEKGEKLKCERNKNKHSLENAFVLLHFYFSFCFFLLFSLFFFWRNEKNLPLSDDVRKRHVFNRTCMYFCVKNMLSCFYELRHLRLSDKNRFLMRYFVRYYTRNIWIASNNLGEMVERISSCRCCSYKIFYHYSRKLFSFLLSRVCYFIFFFVSPVHWNSICSFFFIFFIFLCCFSAVSVGCCSFCTLISPWESNTIYL